MIGRVALAQAPPTPPVLVRAQTAQGTVQGAALGRVIAFLGLPYAAPPVGALRFMPPQPPADWTGVRPALDMGPACPQLVDFDPTENSEAVQSEDCLSLNIWTPRVDHGRRPVMLFIHGGAFVVGASRNTFYDGAQLAARGDVVVVTINYRLGAWGFLDLSFLDPRYADSANVGLLDQLAALGWVRANIDRFGGDPDNITLFGESAGAASIGDLLAIPAAKGLFAKAILESGLPSQKTAPDPDSRRAQTAAFMKLAGAQSVAELATKSMEELRTAQEKLFEMNGSDLGQFGPSLDGVLLKERPFTVVAEGRGSRVPLLIGTTSEEMRYFSSAEDIGIERKSRSLMLEQLQASVGPKAEAVLAGYEQLYPKWGDAVVQIVSDSLMRFPAIRLAETAASHQSVYMYLFTYRSDSTYKNFGAAHAMELPFVFGTVNQPEVVAFTGRDPARYRLAQVTMDSWAAFARTGNPTWPSGPKWPAYDATIRATMELGAEVRLVNDPLRQQRELWGGRFPSDEQARRMLTEN
jgi:para-nitrobenzyl esterase